MLCSGTWSVRINSMNTRPKAFVWSKLSATCFGICNPLQLAGAKTHPKTKTKHARTNSKEDHSDLGPVGREQRAPQNTTHPKLQMVGTFDFWQFQVCCVFGCVSLCCWSDPRFLIGRSMRLLLPPPFSSNVSACAAKTQPLQHSFGWQLSPEVLLNSGNISKKPLLTAFFTPRLWKSPSQHALLKCSVMLWPCSPNSQPFRDWRFKSVSALSMLPSRESPATNYSGCAVSWKYLSNAEHPEPCDVARCNGTSPSCVLMSFKANLCLLSFSGFFGIRHFQAFSSARLGTFGHTQTKTSPFRHSKQKHRHNFTWSAMRNPGFGNRKPQVFINSTSMGLHSTVERSAGGRDGGFGGGGNWWKPGVSNLWIRHDFAWTVWGSRADKHKHRQQDHEKECAQILPLCHVCCLANQYHHNTRWHANSWVLARDVAQP